VFRIELLPAKHGDAILVEYGKVSKKTSLILIDGGPTNGAHALAARIRAIGRRGQDLELLVVTHVDADHIEGIVRFLSGLTIEPKVREVWFNGWQQISDQLGAMQGEYLSALIEKHRIPWNGVFEGKAVMVHDRGPLPCITLPGGMRLTILSPTAEKLQRLRSVWKTVIEAEGLVPGNQKKALDKLKKTKRLGPLDQLGDWVAAKAGAPFTPDRTTPNGSSIAFLAEYEGSSCLFLADAHSEIIEASLRRLAVERRVNRIKVNAVKLAHHGSKNNLSRELLDQLSCKHYLVSTNGDKFGHPDAEAIARVIKYGGVAPEIHFNYRRTQREFDGSNMKRYGYTVKYPKTDQDGITLEL
jgi:beta-lactamase superfamily II metal-dependent hydrolase